MNSALNILGCALLLTLTVIFPALSLERHLLKIHLSSHQAFFSIFFQDYHEGRPDARPMLWLPICALGISFCQLAILYMPFWPWQALPAFGSLDFLIFLLFSILTNLLLATAIWLGKSSTAALFFSQRLTAQLGNCLLALLIFANIALLNTESSIINVSQNQQLLAWGLVPKWNFWQIPISFCTMLWLLIGLYHQRQNGFKGDLLSKNVLAHHSSFERLIIELATNFDGLGWTILTIILFMGGWGLPEWSKNILNQPEPWLVILLQTAILLVKLVILILVIRGLAKRYVEQSVLADTRIIIKILLPANLLQIIITLFLHQYPLT